MGDLRPQRFALRASQTSCDDCSDMRQGCLALRCTGTFPAEVRSVHLAGITYLKHPPLEGPTSNSLPDESFS
jgi:hypothetical protein